MSINFRRTSIAQTTKSLIKKRTALQKQMSKATISSKRVTRTGDCVEIKNRPRKYGYSEFGELFDELFKPTYLVY